MLSVLLTLQVWQDGFMSNSWILAGAAPSLPCHGAVNVSGEESLLWKGCVVTYQVEMLTGLESKLRVVAGFLWRGECPGVLLGLSVGLSPKRDGRDGLLQGSVGLCHICTANPVCGFLF